MHARHRLSIAALPALLCPAGRLLAQLPALRLVTSDLPPMATPGPAGQRGVLLDVAEALLDRCEMGTQPEFYPWARAMLLAGGAPRTLILPLNRTPEREARFQWLVKLYAQRFAFLTLAGRPRIDTLEQAREARVGGLRGSSNLDKLLALGLQPGRIYQANSVTDMHRALERGLVDAVYGSELIHTDAWQRSGRDPARLQPGLALESADIWLAAQSGITDTEQARLRGCHAAMAADGSLERIFRRYGIRPRPEDLRAS